MLLTIILTLGLNLGDINVDSVPITDDVTGSEILEIDEDVTDDDLTDNEEEPILLLSEPSYDLQILEELQKSNEYWDLFLDSFSVPFIQTDSLTDLGYGRYISNDGRFTSQTNAKTFSLLLKGGYTYNLKFSGFQYNVNNAYTLLSSIPSNSYQVFSVAYPITNDTITLTPLFDEYLIIGVSGNENNFFISVSHEDYYLESYTLSEIGNAITSVDSKIEGLNDVTRLLECIVFIESCLLIIPWIHKITKKERSL